jgi:transcriptional regulator with XRE-family HTH domain
MDSIGYRIKRKRLERGLSQDELGLLCGWDHSASRISNYESDYRIPVIPDVIKLARALKVSPCWLAFGD